MISDALEIVGDAEILKPVDLKSLALLQKELSHTWETVQIFRTETEMKYSVLQNIKHPTPDSKYWQAVREQNVMFQELVGMSYEFRKNSVEIKQLKAKVKSGDFDEYEVELFQIEIEKKIFGALSMKRIAEDRIREIKQWSAIKAELLPNLRHGDVDVDKHQLEAMKIRFNNEAEMVNNQTAISDKINIMGKAKSINKGT